MIHAVVNFKFTASPEKPVQEPHPSLSKSPSQELKNRQHPFRLAHMHTCPSPSQGVFWGIKPRNGKSKAYRYSAYLWSASRSTGRTGQWQFHWSHWGPSRPPFCLSREHKRQASYEAWAYTWQWLQQQKKRLQKILMCYQFGHYSNILIMAVKLFL